MTIQYPKVKRIKFGSATSYKGHVYYIYLMIEPIKDMINIRSWFQVEIEKGAKVWAFELKKDQTIDNAQNKILDYIDELVKKEAKQ